MRNSFFISILVAILLIAACAQPNENVVQEEPILIGALLPLTGPASWIGIAEQQGIDLAVEDINARGGINGQPIKILYEDTGGIPKEAVTGFNKLMQREPIAIISSLSAVSKAIAPLIDEHEVPGLLVAVSVPGIAAESEWIFRFHVSSDYEAQAMATHIQEHTDIKRVAVVYRNDEYGVGGMQAFNNAFDGVVYPESFDADEHDFKTIITKIGDADGVYILGFTQTMVLFAKQLREMGYEQPIFSNFAMNSRAIMEAGGIAFEGAVYPTLDIDQGDIFEFMAYDAIEHVAATEATTREELRDGLLQSDYDGVTSVQPDGEILYALKMMTIKDGKPVEWEKS